MRSIRATVLKTDYKKGLCKIKDDGTDDVIDGVYILCGFNQSSRLPNKGQQVLVLMDDSLGTGYVLGEFWNGEGMKPPSGTKKDTWKTDVKDVTINAKEKAEFKTKSGADVKVKGKEITVDAASVTFHTNKGTTVI